MSSRPARSLVVAGIILAAGEGRRIGRNKALLQVEGTGSLERVAAGLRSAGCDPVMVVGGAQAGSVREEALRLGIRFVLNRNWRGGQFSSLKAGMSELTRSEASRPPGAERTEQATGESPIAAMVALVDHPLVKKETYQALVRASHESPERIIIPTHRGRRGHPVVVPRQIMSEIICSSDETTLRDVIREHGSTVLERTVEDVGILEDIDSETDLRSARER